jgi:hypothetical protein
MTASGNIHSIATQGTVETPSIPNTLMQIQKNYLVRGFQGYQGCRGLGQVDLSSFFGGFSIQTILLVAGGAFLLYYLLFSSPSAKERRTKKGERLLESERTAHQKRMAAIEKRYGAQRKTTKVVRGSGGRFQRVPAEA